MSVLDETADVTRDRRGVLRAGCGCVSLVLFGGCVGEQPEDAANGSSSAADDGADSSSSENETESTTADGNAGEADRADSDDNGMTDRSPLSNSIAQVAGADNPEPVADAHDIEYRDGEVRVLVQLEPGGELPEDHISTVITELEGSVTAWVAVDSLVALGDDENVRSVRPVPATEPHS